MSGKHGKSNRVMMEAIILMVLLGIVALEMHLVFRGWWVVWDRWMSRNVITPLCLVIGGLAGPMAVLMALKSTGKKIGDEAEEIRRGMRR